MPKKIEKVKFNNFNGEIVKRKKELHEAFNRVLSSGWFVLGKEVESFENEFAGYLGTKHCIGVGNGLEALQISLMALGIKPGDEIITTPISAMATTLAIIAVGATPVFVDTKDGLIDPDLIPAAISRKTKAILPVHLYGQPCQIDRIRRLCKVNNLFLVEDACQAHGSIFKGRKLGTFGDVNCFSFYPTKNLGAFGDGGAIVTNNSRIAKICKIIRDYGQSSKYLHTRYGLNSRLDEVQAAILRVKLEYLEEDNARRRSLVEKYYKELSGLSNLDLIGREHLSNSNYHLFVIKTPRRDDLRKYLSEKGIQTLIHYPKIIPDQPIYRSLGHKKTYLKESKKFVKEVLSLPCSPSTTYREVDYISKQIKVFFGQVDYLR